MAELIRLLQGGPKTESTLTARMNMHNYAIDQTKFFGHHDM